MNVDKVYILEDRGVLYVNGDDCTEFLQNLITNDLNKVSEDNSCFASLLTPQGKYLFDFIIVKHKNGYFLDCEKIQAAKLIDRLNIYKLNSSVEILNLSNEFEVAVINKEKFLSLDGLYRALGKGARNKNYPQFSDHYFTGEYPIEPSDTLDKEKVTQLSLLSSKSNT